MSLAKSIKANIDDLFRYGPQFLLRHLSRINGAKTFLVRVDGQPIHVRPKDSDASVVRQVFGEDHYNSRARRVDDRYQEIVDSGQTPVIVDAGANIGAASLWFKRRYPKATVVAVEPDARNFEVLVKNADLSSGIIPKHAAIGSEDGFVTVHARGPGLSTRVERADDGLSILTMRAAFTAANGVPFIAKIDIEGFEQELFSKNTDWLDDVFVVHLEPHAWMLPGKGSTLGFQRALAKHDFDLYITGEVLTYVRHTGRE
ncbi:FkbM family methyltransferase [Bradyrhizobium ottawaense]|uniref:FkbM family methyltransferase n=1 Tax=Bradyrhizobium ottawaense TaxID=931866 RepID=UPI0035117938